MCVWSFHDIISDKHKLAMQILRYKCLLVGVVVVCILAEPIYGIAPGRKELELNMLGESLKYCPGRERSVLKTSLAGEQPKSSLRMFIIERKIRGRSSTQLVVSCLVAREVFRDRWKSLNKAICAKMVTRCFYVFDAE